MTYVHVIIYDHIVTRVGLVEKHKYHDNEQKLEISM